MTIEIDPQTRTEAAEPSREIVVTERQAVAKCLTIEDVRTLVDISLQGAATRGAEFYAWRNPPEYTDGAFRHTSGWGESATTREIRPDEALEIYKQKLDGAYGERFLLMMCTVAGLVERGHEVALLQLQEEPGAPFDAKGWIVVSVDTFPMFHIAPSDLSMGAVSEKGLVTVVQAGSPEAERHGWKGTNKIQEFELLLKWSVNPPQG